MIAQSLQDRVDQYMDIYNELKHGLKWKVSEKRTQMMIASMYVTNQKSFDKERFLEIGQFIKEEVGIFSTLRSSYRFIFAALLDVRFDDPKEEFKKMIEYYNTFIDKKFSRSVFTYISAYLLLTNDTEGKDPEEVIQKAKDMYDGMSDNHPFLTTSSDYPLAVLLSFSDGPIEETLDRMERFYTKLNQKGFKKGNELQFLSHFLTFKEGVDEDKVVERCDEVFETFKRLGAKPKAQHYPSLGILSLIDHGTYEVERVMDVYEQFNNVKGFKWYKDINFTMAVNLTVSHEVEDTTLMDSGIYTTLETIMQAQQLAMVVSVAGVAAATGGDGG